MMDKTEAGQRCRKYLEDKISNEDKLVFWPHKRMIQVSDIDVFHEIAKKFNVTNLSETKNYYVIGVPNKPVKEYWTVALDSDLIKDFLNKYKYKYKVLK
ncbi:MAG: hypothetical protein AABW90_00770 [Nanoarchaeota archaeon]